MRPVPSILIVLSALPCAAASPAGSFVPGEVIVRFKDTANGLDVSRALGHSGGRIKERLGASSAAPLAGRSPGLVRVATTRDVGDAVRLLGADPSVAYAEPNFTCTHALVSDDNYYKAGYLWGTYSGDSPADVGPAFTTNAFGSEAEQAWSAGLTGSTDVFVGVVDEGIAVDHPDLHANTWTNPWDPPDGQDNDGNGFVDDVHGWDFVNGDNSVYDGGATASEDRHGTHVAGTIGAIGGNNAGVAGMCWHVTLVSTKVLGPGGGNTADAARAIDYLTNLKTRHGMRLVAINNSWAASGYSQTLADAVIRAARAGIVVVCAAGNDSVDTDVSPVYPACLDTTHGTTTQAAATWDAVVSVAAITPQGTLASFSNHGATTVDLGAPGVSINSTMPPSTYGSYSGTSMASPHVTGAAALYAAANPAATGSEIRQALLAQARPTVALAGDCATGGRLAVGGFVVVHDIEVSAMSAPASIVSGRTNSLLVDVTNQGAGPETFTVTVSSTPPAGGRSGSLSGPQQITLQAGQSAAVEFSWSTKGATIGLHSLTASVRSIVGESDLSDNSTSTTAAVVAPLAPTTGVAVGRLAGF